MNKKTKRIIRRWLALVLITALIGQTVSMRFFDTAYAADTEQIVSETGTEAVTETNFSRPVTVLGEVESLRTEDEKHFRMSDGTYMAVSYGMPVHVMDEDGEWQDIDNRMILSPDQTEYTTQNLRTSASFSASLVAGSLFETSNGDTSVAMSLMDTSQANQIMSQFVSEIQAEMSRIHEPALSQSSLSQKREMTKEMELIENILIEETTLLTFNRTASADITVTTPTMVNTGSVSSEAARNKDGWTAVDILPEHLQSSVLYEDVFPNIDLLYTKYSHHVKEEIIVKAPQNTYRYDFGLTLDGVKAQQNEDGSIYLINGDGEIAYYIPVPFMLDDNGIASHDVEYVLTPTANGVILSVVADAEWMNDPERAYPVSIDPTVRVIQKGEAREDIASGYVLEGLPNNAYGGAPDLWVGWTQWNSLKESIAYLYFDRLPDVPAGSTVVDAWLQMYMLGYSQVGMNQLGIGVYEVTEDDSADWNSYYEWVTLLTWNTKPAYNQQNMLDYSIVSAATQNTNVYWEVTELVKKWYNEGTTNRTIALCITPGPTYQNSSCANATFYGWNASNPPMLLVSYRDQIGIEPYYTYQTFNTENAGTAYIADATGQIKVVKNVLSYASEVNPFSLNLVYNSDYFSDNASEDYQPPTEMGVGNIATRIGQGWTLDIIQTMKTETIGDEMYICYQDGDGTKHYFSVDSAKNAADDEDITYYYDEDGLGLKVKITAGETLPDDQPKSFVMYDDSGNSWTFTDGRLTQTRDANDNLYTINYYNSNLVSVYQTNNGQSSVMVAEVEYDDVYVDNVARIIDAAGNETCFVYSGTKLSYLEKNGTRIAEYGYPSSGNQLVWLLDKLDGNEWNFQYTNGRCSMIFEYDWDLEGDNNYGPEVNITYPGYNQTVYADTGNDRRGGTADDLYTTYLFDHAGRTVNVYTKDASGKLIGASNAAYTGSASTDKQNNRVIKTASTGAATANLLQNGGFEDTSYPWSMENAVRATTDARTGMYALKGTSTASATNISAVKTITLTAGTDYTLSAYVKTTDVTSINGSGVYLSAKNGGGTTHTGGVSLKSRVDYVTDDETDDGWVRIQMSFTPAATESYTVGVCASGIIGTFYVDDIQLEKGNTAGSVNLLNNAQMDTVNYGWGSGTGWEYSGGTMKITGSPLTEASVSQIVSIYLSGTHTYVLSGWVKANAVPDNMNEAVDPAQDLYKQCGLRAEITYTSGNDIEYHYIPFNTDLSNVWQYVSMAIVPEQPEKTVKNIKVTLAYERNANIAYFDDIALTRENVQSMTYDADGNLTVAKTTGVNADTNSYADNKLSSVVTGGNGTYDYSYYDDYPFRLKETTDGLITQNMEYDTVGNVKVTSISGNASFDEPKIEEVTVYANRGNLLDFIMDTAENETYYYYNSDLNVAYGLPSSVLDPRGYSTTYQYDDMGRTKQIAVAGNGRIEYTYSGNQLSSILRTDSDNSTQNYNLTYDGFENLTGIAVGSRLLAAYQYGDANGLMVKMTYGNGDAVNYTYDALGRVIRETYSEGRVVDYIYDKDGRLDHISGDYMSRAYYNYDSLGRLIGSGWVPMNTQAIYAYDGNSRLIRTDYSSAGFDIEDWGTWYETYTYNSDTTDTVSDGLLTSMRMNSGANITRGYDYLQRMNTRTVASKLVETYTYQASEEYNTTSIVMNGKKNTVAGEVKSNFTYTYDGNGNILRSDDSENEESVTYFYDSQNQLRRVTHNNGRTEVYTYDSAGNLLTFNNGITSHSYTYGDSNWTDLLTAVDGVNLYYDTSGNPTTYHNGTTYYMTWQEGRKLTRAQVSGGDSVTYTYTSDGLRTFKELDSGDGVAYLISDGKIIGEERYHEDEGFLSAMRYIFDENGSVCGYSIGVLTGGYTLGLTWTDYYFIKNLQGDVLQVFRASDNAIVAEYTYDAWGNILSATGTQASINPFRYRGYYYDEETGFYCLSSRYYDPEVGRFINADSFTSTGQGILGLNMFAYCGNNPVCRVDYSGEDWETINLGGGWTCQIHNPKDGNRHIHIEKRGTSYAQNEDGSPHDKNKNKQGKLPNWLNKKVKEKTGWDYNAKRNAFFGQTKMEYGTAGITYRFADGTTGYRARNPLLLPATSIDSFDAIYRESRVASVGMIPSRTYFIPIINWGQIFSISWSFSWQSIPIPLFN